MARVVFDGATGLVRKLAEVNFERVGRRTEHVDVGAGAKDSRFETSDNDGPDLRMLETQSLNRIREFNVYAEIVGVEFQLVAFSERHVFRNVHREGCN